MMIRPLARLALLVSLFDLGQAAVCYAPDGTTASPDFQPCIAVDGVESSKYKYPHVISLI